MKKSIAILLILVLAGFGLFADVDNTKTDATIEINSLVAGFSAFGVSSSRVNADGFKSIANFQGAVSSSVAKEVIMLELHSLVGVGFLSGLNNTKNVVKLTITIDDMISGKDKVAMMVTPTKIAIAASADSKFGTLQNQLIEVKEKEAGAAALAPAGTYTTTVTIALVTV